MSECVTGYIDHIIFRNEDNGYTVMVLKGVKDEDELTCVGTFPVLRREHRSRQREALYSIPYMANSFRQCG